MAETITSAKNTKLQLLQQLNTKAKARRENSCFVAEGLRLFLEIPRDLIVWTFVSEQFYAEHMPMLLELKQETVFILEDRLFQKASDTKNPQGIMTVVKCPVWTEKQLLRKKDPLLVVLEEVQDPGNVGTIIRTAEGAGADGLILLGNTADIFSPKVIRSTMGSVFRMPHIRFSSAESVSVWLKDHQITSYAAHLSGERIYTDEHYGGGTAFLIGNEGNGLSESLTKAADRTIRIPMEGQVESLNAAVASALLLYEAHRQRT